MKLILVVATVLLSSGVTSQDNGKIDPYLYSWRIVGEWARADKGCEPGIHVAFGDMGRYSAAGVNGPVEGRYSIGDDGTLLMTPRGAGTPHQLRVTDLTRSGFILVRTDGKIVPYVRCLSTREKRVLTVTGPSGELIRPK